MIGGGAGAERQRVGTAAGEPPAQATEDASACVRRLRKDFRKPTSESPLLLQCLRRPRISSAQAPGTGGRTLGHARYRRRRRTVRRLRFTSHALEQMHERRIPRRAVEAVLQDYDVARPAPFRPGAKPAMIYVGEYQGRRLKVYAAQGSDPPLVTTAVWEGDE